MSTDTPVGADRQGQTGSLLIAGFFVLAGAITLYDTTRYTDVDSMVFPRAAATLLIICSLLSLVSTWLRPSAEPGFGQGSWWRRLLLVASMLGACLLMPVIGFLGAGCVAFVGGLIAAMHLRWSAATAFRYGGSGLIIMVGFYALFRYALHVPLP